MQVLAILQWDPSPVAFRIPFVDHAVAWYGILFALGFLLGCLVTRRLVAHYLADSDPTLEPKQLRVYAASFTDRLLWFTVIGTVIGARLGHILFYDFQWYLYHPLDFFKVWQGGLASHGAAIGVVVSLFLFRLTLKSPYPQFSLVRLIDITVLPTALIAIFIRTGNFLNQEVIGTATTLPWAVVFGTPANGSLPLARHPVQLYEALSYAAVFGLLWSLSGYAAVRRRIGLLAGVFFILAFGTRFLLEFFKERQSGWLSDSSTLLMGQYLSLPVVAIGVILVVLSFYQVRSVDGRSS